MSAAAKIIVPNTCRRSNGFFNSRWFLGLGLVAIVSIYTIIAHRIVGIIKPNGIPNTIIAYLWLVGWNVACIKEMLESPKARELSVWERLRIAGHPMLWLVQSAILFPLTPLAIHCIARVRLLPNAMLAMLYAGRINSMPLRILEFFDLHEKGITWLSGMALTACYADMWLQAELGLRLSDTFATVITGIASAGIGDAAVFLIGLLLANTIGSRLAWAIFELFLDFLLVAMDTILPSFKIDEWTRGPSQPNRAIMFAALVATGLDYGVIGKSSLAFTLWISPWVGWMWAFFLFVLTVFIWQRKRPVK